LIGKDGYLSKTDELYISQYPYRVTRNLFQDEDAVSRYSREFDGKLDVEDSLYIIIGSDAGNLVKYLSAIDKPIGTRYVFLETDEIFRLVCDEIDYKAGENNIWISTYDEFFPLLEDVYLTDYLYVNGVRLIKSLSAEYGYVEEYRSLYWEVDTKIQDISWSVRVKLGQALFINNQLENCADNIESASFLKGCLQGRTVILIAGGPSLDRYIDWVANNRDRAIVFAVSRVSKRLLQAGIEPDFLFSVDPEDVSYQISREALEFNGNVTLINQYHVATQLLSQWPHRKFYSGNLLPWDSILNPPRDLYFGGAGPTVTNHALAAAYWMGAGHVVLIGVDLCFPEDGVTHASGSREFEAGPRFDITGLSVITNEGKPASTTSDYLSAADCLDVMAGHFKGLGLEVVTLSEKAMKLSNVPFRTLKEIEFPPIEPFSMSIVQSTSISQLRALSEELDAKADELSTLVDLICSAQKVHNDLYVNEKVVISTKSTLEDIDKNIEQEHTELFRLIKLLSLRGLVRMSVDFIDPESLDIHSVKKRLDIYYESLLQGGLLLKNMLASAIGKVDRRLSERICFEDYKSIDDKVSEGWISNHEYGRFKIYQESCFSSEQLEKLSYAFRKELEVDYNSVLTQESLSASKRALPRRVVEFIDKNDLDSLRNLKVSLEGNKEYEAFIPLIHGAELLLEGDNQLALNAFGAAASNVDSPVLEPCLGYVFRLATDLGYTQVALDALAGLACIDRIYLTHYADALAAVGQLDDAILHEVEYVECFGLHSPSRVKLKAWLTELGRTEELELLRDLDKC